MTLSDVIGQFTEELRRQGLDPVGPIIADGTMRRFKTTDEPQGSEHGWYILHPDYPQSAAFGSWKSGDSRRWSVASDRLSTPAERAELARRAQADRKKHLRERQERQQAAQSRALAIWNGSPSCPPDHAYLTRKSIGPLIARIHEGKVIIPVVSNGQLTSLQMIDCDGNKKFLPDGRIQGCYAHVGPLPDAKGEIIICEGYATAATLLEATGSPVFCAFNASNLKPVAVDIRERWPEATIIIAADNDQFTSKTTPDGARVKFNPGLEAAAKASEAARCVVRSPSFAPGYEGRPTDFNDLAALEGLGVVKAQVSLRPVVPIEAVPERPAAHFPDSVYRDMLPDLSPSLKPLCTQRNLEEILIRIGALYRYNVISKRQEIFIAGRSYSLDNSDNAILADIVDACNRFQMPTGSVDSFLLKLCDQFQYNPVQTWLQAKRWDGVSRLDAFYATVTAVGETEEPDRKELKETLMRRWLISAVAAACRPRGISAHGVLVFQGAQYLGKTAWFKSLVPAEMELVADGLTLDPRDKDSVALITSYWLVELGELDATFRKADIAQLKAFITRDKDLIRLPYARRPSYMPRRTIFFASVNQRSFLADSTGNRRYWTIECEALNHKHGLDMQQVWAEVYERYYLKGESWFLTPDELKRLNAHNTDFEVMEPLEERLIEGFNWHLNPRPIGSWMTLTAILKTVGLETPNRHDFNAASSLIQKLNGGLRRKTNGQVRFWVPTVAKPEVPWS